MRYVVSTQGFFGRTSEHRVLARAQAAARRLAKRYPTHGVVIQHLDSEWPHFEHHIEVVQPKSADANHPPRGWEYFLQGWTSDHREAWESWHREASAPRAEEENGR